MKVLSSFESEMEAVAAVISVVVEADSHLIQFNFNFKSFVLLHKFHFTQTFDFIFIAYFNESFWKMWKNTPNTKVQSWGGGGGDVRKRKKKKKCNLI